MLLGIKKTTPAIASAMPNLCPGLIFIIAACLRLEKFDKACKYTQAKILGTVVCLVGAMALSFLQNPSSPSPAEGCWLEHVVVFQTWSLGKKGPLFVSVFGPVQTVCSGILSAALLGKTVSLGSMAGMVLMFSGLYIVLWAKNKERLQLEGGGADVEKALLS
ncbi:hypothetical protein PR202_ga18404 [Eleusine coracana subsp. coracana]|uniref:WAT1-related protein n=1 Tax=Eleusine coracana subsp. coracana TaxID=191504 RepID=A0AAV5CSZ6_ELECO|nr:hypothetical protein PR202_ga18404 [Eleusine coracana subsp. coracana]